LSILAEVSDVDIFVH